MSLKNWTHSEGVDHQIEQEILDSDLEMDEVSRKKPRVGVTFEVDEKTPIKNSYLVSADYDPGKATVYLKFYDPKTNSIHLWFDKTDHHPYCFAKESVGKLRRHPAIKGNKYVVDLKSEVKRDPLSDGDIEVTKIVTTDPLAVGGTSFSLRSKMRVWEADIKYYANYIFDQGLQVGRPYDVVGNEIKPIRVKIDERVRKLASALLEEAPEGEREEIEEWVEILSAEVPKYRRVAFDLEIYTEEEDRLPLASQARDPIVAASFRGSDGLKVVLLYNISGEISRGDFADEEFEVEVFDDERSLIERAIKILMDYPFIVTFNGDNFDIPYLYHRALNLGIPREKIPIQVGKRDARAIWGVHIDLYRFFFNKSVKVYAFRNRYGDISLNEIALSLLGIGKIKLEEHISKLSAKDLAKYSFRDSEITYRLTSFNSDLVMRLITMLGRISNMTLDDVCRLAVSNWIKNRMICMHRKLGCLIPLKEEIKGKGERRYTEPVTRGKKYIGAVVVEPKPGVHFNVYVVDYASLYPSIMGEYNISYETVNCTHEECRGNVVPGTGHWVCTKRKGMASRLVGIIRDLRVRVFKKLAKSRGLSPEAREFYDVVQNALKVILNASYGVFGAEEFPFYYLPAAESVTMYGRNIITETLDFCKESGINVLYGDTDSLFLLKPDRKEMETLITWGKKNFHLDLEVDKIYRYIAFSLRKKNYFGILEDGVVDVKGLVGKKRNTPELIKRAFYQALEALRSVRSPEEFEEARERVREIVSETEEKIRRREVTLEDLAISTTLTKRLKAYVKTTPQHVKAAKLLQTVRGREVIPGETIRYVKTTTKPGVKPLEGTSMREVDVGKYVELLRSTFEQLLDVMGVKLGKEVRAGYGRLEDFM